MLIDDVSALNLYLNDGSTFTGAVNPTGQQGDVYVELDANSTWTLTDDSYVTSLTCVQGSINLNGHKLYVNGVEYDGESAVAGSAVDTSSSASGSTDGQPGAAPEAPGDSNGPSGNGGATPPSKPGE